MKNLITNVSLGRGALGDAEASLEDIFKNVASILREIPLRGQNKANRDKIVDILGRVDVVQVYDDKLDLALKPEIYDQIRAHQCHEPGKCDPRCKKPNEQLGSHGQLLR